MGSVFPSKPAEPGRVPLMAAAAAAQVFLIDRPRTSLEFTGRLATAVPFLDQLAKHAPADHADMLDAVAARAARFAETSISRSFKG